MHPVRRQEFWDDVGWVLRPQQHVQPRGWRKGCQSTRPLCLFHCDGIARRGAADRDVVVLAEARWRKERTAREFIQPGHRAKLVVLACEVGGRRCDKAVTSIRYLAKARARAEPAVLKRRDGQGWCGLLAYVAARAFAASHLKRPFHGGADGDTPSVRQVLNECRFAGLGLAA